MAQRYAQHTDVSQSRSKEEIERLIERYGADQFVSGWRKGQAMISFTLHNKIVRILLPLPDPDDEEFRKTPTGRARRDGSVNEHYHREVRRRWRSLALVIKAKLEAVESGITTFEQEFLAHIVMPDDRTVAEHAFPWMEKAIATGQVPKLLPMGSP